MSRQDANAAFALTSFLYGGNAAYIEDLYARYEADPAVGRRRVAGVLPEPEGRRRATSPKNAHGPSWQRPDWPPRPRGELVAALDGDWAEAEQGARRQDQGARRRRSGVELSAAEVAAGDARFDPRADADPRLPHARSFPRQSRSARPRAAARTRRSSIRAPTASPRPISTARSSSTTCSASNSARCARSSPSCGAPIARRSASNSCTSPTARRRRWIQERIEGPDKEITLHPRGQARHPQQAGRGRRLREILRREIHRHQALRPRRRRSR